MSLRESRLRIIENTLVVLKYTENYARHLNKIAIGTEEETNLLLSRQYN